MVSYMDNGCAVEDHLYLWSYLPRFSRHLPADGVEELLFVRLLRRQGYSAMAAIERRVQAVTYLADSPKHLNMISVEIQFLRCSFKPCFLFAVQ